MKRQKTKNKNHSIVVLLLMAIVILFSGLIFCLIKLNYSEYKTNDEKEYLGVYEHLLSEHVKNKCAKIEGYNSVCMMKEYGVSKDGDPYVTYFQQKYDPETHEKIDEAEEYIIFFQHRDDAIDGYAEALVEVK